MTAVTIIAAEGILKTGDGRRIDAGCRLYRAIAGQPGSQVILITTGTSEAVQRFLLAQHLPSPAYIRQAVGPAEWEAACNDLRRTYPFPVDQVILPDPGAAALLYLNGFRVLTCLDPRYSRREHRPDTELPPAAGWSALAAAFEADKEHT